MIENVSLCHHPVARRCAINFIMKRVTCNGDGHILTGVHCADYITVTLFAGTPDPLCRRINVNGTPMARQSSVF